MDERFETSIENDDEWFSDIELRALDLEKEISEWRESRARELAESARRRDRERELAESAYLRERERELAEAELEPEPDHTQAFHYGGAGRGRREFLRATGGTGAGYDAERTTTGRAREGSAARHSWPVREDDRGSADDRTQALIDRGRRTARQPRTGRAARGRRGRNVAIASAAGLVFVIVCAMVLFRGGPSWPPSVATMKSEITAACQNPDVASEPGQVNFACGRDTSQILWVFALLTSGGSPGYADARTGRKGLEPITPAQGGQIAWSLNLHHPYDPLSPADSLAVAARAIDNIIGGATLTGTSGSPAVQPGLEARPENCARYTGSAAVISRAGFPGLCATPVTSTEGQAALVADVYRQWMPGATPVAAQDAAVLFADSGSPGDPQVRAILKTLPDTGR